MTVPRPPDDKPFAPSPLVVAQYNCQSLIGKKRDEAAILFGKGSIDMGLYQETKVRSSEVYAVSSVIQARAAGNGKDFGCEIWIRDRLCVGTVRGGKVRISKDSVSIVFAHPRLLVVSVTTGVGAVALFLLTSHMVKELM